MISVFYHYQLKIITYNSKLIKNNIQSHQNVRFLGLTDLLELEPPHIDTRIYIYPYDRDCSPSHYYIYVGVERSAAAKWTRARARLFEFSRSASPALCLLDYFSSACAHGLAFSSFQPIKLIILRIFIYSARVCLYYNTTIFVI